MSDAPAPSHARHQAPPASGGAEPAAPIQRAVDSVAPARLGQYEVHERIGLGGMGAVHRAFHTRLKRWVALKILPLDRVGDREAVARFRREMEAIGQLDHPNIVRATDAGDVGDVHFLVMELIDGIDLARVSRARGPLPVAEACELVRQAAVGLHYVHEKGLIHRDIKPSNLLLSAQGEVKILDLGLARLGGDRPSADQLTAVGQAMGTADYMAPEQWEASRTVDIRADLYSLGCTFHTLLAGRAPFSGPGYDSVYKKMAAHAQALPPPVRAARPDVPDGVEAIIQRLLAKDPAARYAVPKDLALSLAQFCGGADLAALVGAARGEEAPGGLGEHSKGPFEGISPSALSAASTRSMARRPLHWVLVAAAGVVAAAAVLWGVHPAGPTAAPQDPNPGVGAAPSPGEGAPRDLRLRQWNNLLDRPPAELSWPDLQGESLWRLNPETQVLSVQTPRTGLLSLGKVESRGYKLQIGLKQPRWAGGVGVFFGARWETEAGIRVLRFQALQLRPSPQGGVARPLTLLRSRNRLPLIPGHEPSVEVIGVTSNPISPPPVNQEILLELTVERQGLTRVRWNGEDLPKLVDDTVNARFKEEDYQGELGLFCVASSIVVSTARILPTE